MKELLVVIAFLLIIVACNQVYGDRGIYFSKKVYVPPPLNAFEKTRDKLPDPIFYNKNKYTSIELKDCRDGI